MDDFKRASSNLATSIDYNAKCCKRAKGDGEMVRRQARTKLKNELEKEIRNESSGNIL